MIIFCREHGWQYNAIMCYKCNKMDIIRLLWDSDADMDDDSTEE